MDIFPQKMCNFNWLASEFVYEHLKYGKNWVQQKFGGVAGVAWNFLSKRSPSGLIRKLGVDLQYRKSSAKPWLTNITDGLVLQWNQARTPHWWHCAEGVLPPPWFLFMLRTHTIWNANATTLQDLKSRYKKSKTQKIWRVVGLKYWISGLIFLPLSSTFYFISFQHSHCLKTYNVKWTDSPSHFVNKMSMKSLENSRSKRNEVYMFTMHIYVYIFIYLLRSIRLL